jgi:hypothetical protein
MLGRLLSSLRLRLLLGRRGGGGLLVGDGE